MFLAFRPCLPSLPFVLAFSVLSVRASYGLIVNLLRLNCALPSVRAIVSAILNALRGPFLDGAGRPNGGSLLATDSESNMISCDHGSPAPLPRVVPSRSPLLVALPVTSNR